MTAEEKGLEAKIQKGIFQREAQSPLLYLIVMIPFNHTLCKCSGGNKLTKSLDKNNHLMYMHDIKLFAKKEKRIETLIHSVKIFSPDKGMEFGKEKYL